MKRWLLLFGVGLILVHLPLGGWAEPENAITLQKVHVWEGSDIFEVIPDGEIITIMEERESETQGDMFLVEFIKDGEEVSGWVRANEVAMEGTDAYADKLRQIRKAKIPFEMIAKTLVGVLVLGGLGWAIRRFQPVKKIRLFVDQYDTSSPKVQASRATEPESPFAEPGKTGGAVGVPAGVSAQVGSEEKSVLKEVARLSKEMGDAAAVSCQEVANKTFLQGLENAAARCRGMGIRIRSCDANAFWGEAGRAREQIGQEGVLGDFRFNVGAYKRGYSGASFTVDLDSRKVKVLLEELDAIGGSMASHVEPEAPEVAEIVGDIQCAECNGNFDWVHSYWQMNTPGAVDEDGKRQTKRPRTFCPNCGALVCEYDVDEETWSWVGTYGDLNEGKEFPPSGFDLLLKAKSPWWHERHVPRVAIVPFDKDRLDLTKLKFTDHSEDEIEGLEEEDREFYLRCTTAQFEEGAEDRTPDIHPVLRRLHEAHDQGNHSEVLREAPDAANAVPGFGPVYQWWATSLMETGRSNEAKELLQIGVQEAKQKSCLCKDLAEMEWQEARDLRNTLYWCCQGIHCSQAVPNGDDTPQAYARAIADGLGVPGPASSTELAEDFRAELMEAAEQDASLVLQMIFEALVDLQGEETSSQQTPVSEKREERSMPTLEEIPKTKPSSRQIMPPKVDFVAEREEEDDTQTFSCKHCGQYTCPYEGTVCVTCKETLVPDLKALEQQIIDSKSLTTEQLKEMEDLGQLLPDTTLLNSYNAIDAAFKSGGITEKQRKVLRKVLGAMDMAMYRDVSRKKG